jgi:DNA-binding LytR/AlgR family response regulator
LKPIRKSDLAEALKKFSSLKSAFSIDFDEIIARLQNREPEFKKRFLIQIGDKIKKVEVPDIAYIFVLEKGVYLRTFQGSTFPVEYTLEKLETLLTPEIFFRINRKYMVNINAISTMVAYSRSRVKIELTPKADDPFETIVSIDRSAEFKKWLNR